jgi:hypothetical protein
MKQAFYRCDLPVDGVGEGIGLRLRGKEKLNKNGCRAEACRTMRKGSPVCINASALA